MIATKIDELIKANILLEKLERQTKEYPTFQVESNLNIQIALKEKLKKIIERLKEDINQSIKGG